MNRAASQENFLHMRNKDADKLPGNSAAVQRIWFRYIDSTILFFLNLKFQAFGHFLWLYSPVFVGAGRKPEDKFSRGATHFMEH